MNERVPLSRFMPYGAPDLLVAARPNLAAALVVASTMTAAVFALVRVLPLSHALAPPQRPVIVDFGPMPAPPAVRVERTPAPAVPRTRVVAPAMGDVVPDEMVRSQATPAPPDVTSGTGDPDGTARAGDVVQLTPAAPESLPVEGVWQDLETLPRALKIVTADYPEIAKQAGVEGWVLVHVLVGRDGRIVDVRLDERRHVPMLDESALAAARQFVFEAATSNGHRVAAWVDVPFHFTLHN